MESSQTFCSLSISAVILPFLAAPKKEKNELKRRRRAPHARRPVSSLPPPAAPAIPARASATCGRRAPALARCFERDDTVHGPIFFFPRFPFPSFLGRAADDDCCLGHLLTGGGASFGAPTDLSERDTATCAKVPDAALLFFSLLLVFSRACPPASVLTTIGAPAWSSLFFRSNASQHATTDTTHQPTAPHHTLPTLATWSQYVVPLLPGPRARSLPSQSFVGGRNDVTRAQIGTSDRSVRTACCDQ